MLGRLASQRVREIRQALRQLPQVFVSPFLDFSPFLRPFFISDGVFAGITIVLDCAELCELTIWFHCYLD